MANPLTKKLVTGTVGELLVQLRLLQFDVQAAPPIKDTGNDLVALRRGSIRTVQIKTRKGKSYSPGKLPEHYDLLAVVHLCGENNILHLDRSKVYLIGRDELDAAPRQFSELDDYRLNSTRVDDLFGPVPVGQLGNVPNL